MKSGRTHLPVTPLRLPETRLQVVGVDGAVAIASISATAKLLSSIGLGGLAAKKPGVLDPPTVAALSRLTYWVFQPAFLLCSVSKTLVNAKNGTMPARMLALVPFVAVLQIGLGALTGLFVTKVTGIKGDEARDVRMCTSFANSGPLPLIFADALFAGKPAISSQITALISFYLLVWSPLFWSFGRMILGTYGSYQTHESVSFSTKIFREVKRFLSPPVIGCLFGITIGIVPFLRNVFFRGPGIPFYGALQTLGSAYLPVAILILAGSLVNNTSPEKDHVPNQPSMTALGCIFVSRFLLAPLVSAGIIHVAALAGLLGAAGTTSRAVVTFVILMEGCMPPAQNSVIMLQLEGLKDRASTMAKLLTIMYAVGVIPVTLLLTACLSATRILNI